MRIISDFTISLPDEIKLFLCKPNRELVVELPESYERHLTINDGGINELSFSIPFKILDKSSQSIKNPNFDKIMGDYLIRFEQGNKIDYYILTTPMRMSTDGKEYLQLKAYQQQYELKDVVVETLQGNLVFHDPIGDTGFLNKTLLAKTDWQVDHVDAELLTKYIEFNESYKNMLELITGVVEKLGVVPVYDTLNRRVSFYLEENHGIDEGLSVADGKYLKDIEYTEDFENICTRLIVVGKDGVSINDKNVTGTNYFENLDYYLFPFQRQAAISVLGNYVGSGATYQTGKYGQAIKVAASGEKVYWTVSAFSQFTFTSWWIPNLNSSAMSVNKIVARIQKDNNNYVQIKYDPTGTKFILEKSINGTVVTANSLSLSFSSGQAIFTAIRQTSTKTIAYIGLHNGAFSWISFPSNDNTIVPNLTTAYLGCSPVDGNEANALFDQTHLTAKTMSDYEISSLHYGTGAVPQTYGAQTMFLANFNGNLEGGTPVPYVISSSKYMSDSLANAICDYNDLVASKQSQFDGYLTQKATYETDMTTLQSQMSTLNSELQTILDNIDKGIRDGTNLTSLNSQKSAKNTDISNKQSEINAKQAQIDAVDTQITTLRNQLSITANFTAQQILERNRFIKTKVWQDNSFSNIDTLKAEAAKRLTYLSTPFVSYKIGVISLSQALNVDILERDMLKPGALITIYYPNFGINVVAKILTIDWDIDGYSVELTIANKRDLTSDWEKYRELLRKSVSTSAAVDMSRYKWDKSEANDTAISQILNNAWDANLRAIQGGLNEIYSLDRQGLTLKTDTDPLNYLRAVHNCLAFTNDGGNSYKNAITPEGVNATVVTGILGAFAQIRANQIIVGDGNEKIPDSVIQSSANWNGRTTLLTGAGVYTGTVYANQIVVGGGTIGDALLSSASAWNGKTTLLTGSGVYTGTVYANQIVVGGGTIPDSLLSSASTWNGKTTLINSSGVYTGTVYANQIVVGGGAIGDSLISSSTNWNNGVTTANNAQSTANAAQATANNSVQQNTLYNGVKINTTIGFQSIRSDNKFRTTVNATDGIKLQKSGDGINWTDVFSADTSGNLSITGNINATGGTFSGVITGAAFQTAATGGRLVISCSSGSFGPFNWSGIESYNSNNQKDGFFCTAPITPGATGSMSMWYAGNSIFSIVLGGGTISGGYAPAQVQFYGQIGMDGQFVEGHGAWSFTDISLNAGTDTSASGGSASALPSAPAGYTFIKIMGTTYKIPFYF